jgi:hypothetical protein
MKCPIIIVISIIFFGLNSPVSYAAELLFTCSGVYYVNAEELCKKETKSNHCVEISAVIKNTNKSDKLTVVALGKNNKVLYVFEVPADPNNALVIFKKKVSEKFMFSKEAATRKVEKCVAQ